jgi:hypothetical protein
VRIRIKRGRLDSIKEPSDHTGTVYVLLEADQTGQNTDPTSQGQDQTSDQTQVVEALREQVAYLRGVIAARDRELALRAEEIRRRDTALEREQQLTAMFADRLRALEAPASSSEARESLESSSSTDTPSLGGGDARAATERPRAQRPSGGVEHDASTLRGWSGDVEARRRPWWRRVFGS